MDLQADMKWIISELRNVKDPDLIRVFKNLLQYRIKKEEADWWNEISDEEKRDIEAGLEQIEKGEVLTHEQVMRNPRKWS